MNTLMKKVGVIALSVSTALGGALMPVVASADEGVRESDANACNGRRTRAESSRPDMRRFEGAHGAARALRGVESGVKRFEREESRRRFKIPKRDSARRGGSNGRPRGRAAQRLGRSETSQSRNEPCVSRGFERRKRSRTAPAPENTHGEMSRDRLQRKRDRIEFLNTVVR